MSDNIISHNAEIVNRLRTDKEARERFKRNLVEKHEAEGNGQDFREWALELLEGAIWSELFAHKDSSYPVNLRGLTRADGQRMTRGWRL